MQGFIRAIARLFAMGVVMAAVLIAAVVVGVGTTTAIAIGIVAAGVVGLIGVARRPRASSAADEIAAIMAAPHPAAAAQAAEALARANSTPAVEAMQPQGAQVDPEASMPRWRRPSLLEARRSDPTRQAPAYRLPMRFGEDLPEGIDLRTVRYAVVPVLDRPDEVLGIRLSDLGSGDEVQVIEGSGTFMQVLCPNGDRGWVHRTTLSQPSAVRTSDTFRPALAPEADEALNALLTARGLI